MTAERTRIEPQTWLARADADLDRNERRVREGFWRKLKRFAARVPMAEEFVASYYAAFDRETPTRVRALLLAALAYFVLPVDFVPDFIAGFGFTDDVTVLLTVLGTLRAHIKPSHRAAARRAVDEMKATSV